MNLQRARANTTPATVQLYSSYPLPEALVTEEEKAVNRQEPEHRQVLVVQDDSITSELVDTRMRSISITESSRTFASDSFEIEVYFEADSDRIWQTKHQELIKTEGLGQSISIIP